jgi:hypothetical protein
VINQQVLEPLSQKIIAGKVREGDTVLLDTAGESFSFSGASSLRQTA